MFFLILQKGQEQIQFARDGFPATHFTSVAQPLSFLVRAAFPPLDPMYQLGSRRLLGGMIMARLLLLGHDFNEKRSVSLAGLSVQ